MLSVFSFLKKHLQSRFFKGFKSCIVYIMSASCSGSIGVFWCGNATSRRSADYQWQDVSHAASTLVWMHHTNKNEDRKDEAP